MIYKYGIDFGTTNSSIAIRFADESQVEHTLVVDLKDRYPKETIPSIACITEDGNISVGVDAYTQMSNYKSKHKEASLIKKIKMDLEKEGTSLSYTVGRRTFTGVEIIAAILKYLRIRAEHELAPLGIKISGVVLGVPVQYGDIQKNILKEALVEAGYYSNISEANQYTEFVSEPVAVAVHYGLNTTDNKTVMVFDFGGGTLDIAIVNLKDQVGVDHLHPHEVIAKNRITLGGEELTKLFFINTFCSRSGYGIGAICKAFHIARDKKLTPESLWTKLSQHNIGLELIDEIEECKCELSTAKIYDFSFLGPRGITLEKKQIFRASFEEAIAPALKRIEDGIDSCLELGGIDDPYEIDHVIIAGGSSLIPCVQELLFDRFGKKKVSTKPGNTLKKAGNFSNRYTESEVLTSIVRGLATVGCRKETLIEDIVDNDYGLWDDANEDFIPIIKSGTPVKEAAQFDKVFQSGHFKEVECENEFQTEVTVKVYQRNLNGLEQLGRIFISDAGGKKYRVFMYVEPKQGKLNVKMYDIVKKHWFDDIPLNQSQYDIGKT